MAARVAAIWRYPVKSMLGESIRSSAIGPAGVAGDRAYALVDVEDGKVASAKNPRKWESLLSCRATADDGAVHITLPDGSTLSADDPEIDAALSKAVGRKVRLASSPPEAPAFEEVWPDIGGLAPERLIENTNIGLSEDGERISQFPLAAEAPPGTFFDLSVLHFITTSTLDHLKGLAPDATFDVRRYRPNLLIETDDENGFVENEWVGRTLQIGDSTQVTVTYPAMRCVMTTLAQEDLPRDRETLRTIATHNRVKIEGWGTWACAGAYGNITVPGEVRVGDAVTLT